MFMYYKFKSPPMNVESYRIDGIFTEEKIDEMFSILPTGIAGVSLIRAINRTEKT